MKRLIPFVALAVLAGSIVAVLATDVHAGRSGGSTYWRGVAPAYQSVVYNVSFDAGTPAEILVSGSTTSELSLVVTDANGNSLTGVGVGTHKAVRFDVIHTGYFRIEIQNLGPVANMFMVRTN